MKQFFLIAAYIFANLNQQTKVK